MKKIVVVNTNVLNHGAAALSQGAVNQKDVARNHLSVAAQNRGAANQRDVARSLNAVAKKCAAAKKYVAVNLAAHPKDAAAISAIYCC